MIAVPAQLVADTFAIFRDCGGGRRECVTYWLGPADTPEKVDEVIHPKHASMGGGYQIDDQWLTTFLVRARAPAEECQGSGPYTPARSFPFSNR